MTAKNVFMGKRNILQRGKKKGFQTHQVGVPPKKYFRYLTHNRGRPPYAFYFLFFFKNGKMFRILMVVVLNVNYFVFLNVWVVKITYAVPGRAKFFPIIHSSFCKR